MFAAENCQPATVAGPSSSRRRRLWELPPHCHCPVLGVCLPLATLRKRVMACLPHPPPADDYALHVRAVNESRLRNALSERLHKTLEARAQTAVRQFAAAKSEQAVWDLWRAAVGRGDVAAALWAAITHPRCDDALTERLYRDVHMLQHQAGAAVRADAERVQQRLADGDAAARELLALQQRQQRVQVERAAELEAMHAQLLSARAELLARDTLLAEARAECQHLRAAQPELGTRQALQQRLTEVAERNRQLERQAAAQAWALERQLLLTQGPATTPTESAALAPPQAATAAGFDAPRSQHAASTSASASAAAAAPACSATALRQPAPLSDRAVLCVGGRDAVLAQYRELVERQGGRFVHHDGGREQTQRQLGAVLGAADLVICQTGCISHSAYGLVKLYCKRTGKPCVFVQRSGQASFEQALAVAALQSSKMPAAGLVQRQAS